MKVTDNEEDEKNMLKELLLHWWIVMNNARVDTLLEPLQMLINQPQNLTVRGNN